MRLIDFFFFFVAFSLLQLIMEGSPRWLRDKIDLTNAMRNAPSHPNPDEADLVPAAEILGIYVIYSAVGWLVGWLERASQSIAFVTAQSLIAY